MIYHRIIQRLAMRPKASIGKIYGATKLSRAQSTIAPLPIRVAVIGTTVGLATPALAVVGISRFVLNMIPQYYVGRMTQGAVGLIIGGGSVSLIYNYVIPFCRDQSDFLMPFCLANAISATSWYAMAEAFFGLDVILGVVELELFQSFPLLAVFRGFPLAGALVGGLTAVTAPLLWPFCFKLCWSKELHNALLADNPAWPLDLYSYFVLPIALPLGVAAGSAIHVVLKPILLTPTGVPWTHRSLPFLAALVGIGTIYFGMNRPILEDFLWLNRIDPVSGEQYSQNIMTGRIEKSSKKAVHAGMKRKILGVAHYIRKPILLVSSNFSIATTIKPKTLKSPGIPDKSFTNIEIADMTEYKILYRFVDLLLAFKKKQLLNSSDFTNYHYLLEQQPETFGASISFSEPVQLDASGKHTIIKPVEKVPSSIQIFLNEIENIISLNRLQQLLIGENERKKTSSTKSSSSESTSNASNKDTALLLFTIQKKLKASIENLKKLLKKNSDCLCLLKEVYDEIEPNDENPDSYKRTDIQNLFMNILLKNLSIYENELNHKFKYSIPDITVLEEERKPNGFWPKAFIGVSLVGFILFYADRLIL